MVVGLAPQPQPLCLLVSLPYLTTHDSEPAKDRLASLTLLYTNTVLLPSTILKKGTSYGCGAPNGAEETPSLLVMMWNCTIGCDPVTGMGSPDFEKLRKIVLDF
jgi:hypothetical protein